VRFYAHPTAIRRCALVRCPMPRGLRLVRGQAVVHSLALPQAGFTLWRQPRARTFHPLPTPAGMLWRFVGQRHDSVVLAGLSGDRTGRSFRGFLQPLDHPVARTTHVLQRARAVLAEDRLRWLLLPAVLPVGAVFTLAYLAGRVLTRIAPATADRLLGVCT